MKECNSRFSMSQIIWTLTKDVEESNNTHEPKYNYYYISYRIYTFVIKLFEIINVNTIYILFG
jgi:hypothetical protein